MLEILKVVITLLTPASVTLKDIQPKLGSVIKSYPNNTHLKPQDVAFSHIDVVQKYNSEQVGNVEFTLVNPIALEALQAMFGDYQIVVADDQEPNQAIFYIKQPLEACDIALIATLNRKGTETGVVTLRRDAHPKH